MAFSLSCCVGELPMSGWDGMGGGWQIGDSRHRRHVGRKQVARPSIEHVATAVRRLYLKIIADDAGKGDSVVEPAREHLASAPDDDRDDVGLVIEPCVQRRRTRCLLL